MLEINWMKYCWPSFALCTTGTYITEAEAWYPCACGGKDKLNHIVEVSILFPYLIVNTVFLCQKKINVSELEFIINAKYPEKNKGIRQSRSRSMGQDQLFDQSRLLNFLQSCSG